MLMNKYNFRTFIVHILLVNLRHKMQARLKETEEALESLQAKYSALDKTKARIAAELEDLNLDIEKVNFPQP